MFESMLATQSAPPAAARGAGPARASAADRLRAVLAGSAALPSADAQRLAGLRARSPEPARLVLDRIAGMTLSPESLGALRQVDVERLSDYDRVTWLTLWEAHRGWFDAHAQTGIVAVGGALPPAADPAQPDNSRDDVGRDQVALALRLSSTTGGDRLDTARELTGRLRGTLDALARGELTYWHAKAVADAVAPLGDAAALAVQRAALDGAPPFETLTRFRARVARAVIAADPKTADEQHLTAVAGRRVIMWPEPHGMATVQATLTADEAATAMRALTALAGLARADGDDRPVDIRRADAFSRVFDAALADPGLPSEQRTRPAVGMTIDSATLLRLADNPAHLDGYGPIPPAMARRIAAGGDWHRLVTDPIGGALLDYGHTVYRPPADLARYITARDRTCRFPTCNRAARNSDIDHAIPWDEGGPTSARNCGAASRRHHRQKTARNTHLESHPDGSATWTTSTGHTYHQPAVDHCPEHTAYLSQLRAAAESDGEPAAPDDQTTEHVHNAHESAATAHDTVAHEDRDEPQGDTSSGNDPPPF